MARFNRFVDDHDSDGWDEVLCVTLGLPVRSVEARADGCRQFVVAAEQLLNAAQANPVDSRTNTLTGNPICCLVRHAVELALKVACPKAASPIKGHDLEGRLVEVLALGRRLGLPDPLGFEHLVSDFHEVDPGGSLFRYAHEGDRACCVNPIVLRADLVTILTALDDYLVPVGENWDRAVTS